MTPKIVFLNGPPGCGKDAAGKLLEQHNPNVRVTKFAKILKERTHALYGIDDGILGQAAPHDAFEATKDIAQHVFHGLTPRQAYISVAECYFKPVHGPRIFGQLLLRSLINIYGCGIQKNEDIYVVTDSGFREEADVLIEHFGIENCYLVHIHRDGHSFKGDSRSYWNCTGLKTRELLNSGTLDNLLQSLRNDPCFQILPLDDHDPSSCAGPRPHSTN